MSDSFQKSADFMGTEHKAGLPGRRGLYDPQFEHDACGIGMICDIKGRASHKLVTDAIDVLCALSHRGASGADELTGDGAGITWDSTGAVSKSPKGMVIQNGAYVDLD